jgi:hypothetical protein
MDRILQAAAGTSPAARGQLSQRILAVVHQRLVEPGPRRVTGGVEKRPPAVLPALWRQTSSGVAALVSDGLASVIPNHVPLPGEDDTRQVSSFGRHGFALRLPIIKRDNDNDPLKGETDVSYRKALADAAIDVDLRGV